ncbi:MAG: MBL fold metallo-hydrolase [Nitriliruptoraceae bacterium]
MTATSSGLTVTVLGSSGSHTAAGQVCSGYLVETGTTRLLVDAGNGSTANLQRFAEFSAVDAVLISHRHVDHCVDLIGMFYALRFDPTFDRAIPLYAPDEVVETLTSLLSNDARQALAHVFQHQPVAGGSRHVIGDVDVSFYDSVHPPPTVSMRFEHETAVLAYSADSAGGDQLVACAADADVFLCEATWQGDADAYPSGIHLTARAAGAIAQRAGVEKLILTHIAGGLDRHRSLVEAQETFHGPIDVANDLDIWRVP